MRRRDFLKATTLAAGVSLLEACGGPEEQFLVQPVRRSSGDPLPGESVWRNSVCRQCGAGCGIQVRVVDGNAKKIEGLPDHPINAGGVCALGHSLLQEIYNPDRILTPQRRSGERGAGDFAPISWEEALGELVSAITAVDPAGIAMVGGDRSGLVGALLGRLAAAVGAPPPVFVEALELDVERRAARAALGVDDLPYFDVSRSDYVLSIGPAFLDRWHNPVHYTRAFARMRQGTPGRRGKLVQAEARMSLTAASADEWLAPLPGTEGILARTIAGAVLDAGLADARSADRYALLFPDAPPSLEEGAAACDVAADRIRRVASELAAAERRVVMGGGSAAAHENGLFNVTATLALNVLLGTLGEPGGVFGPASFGIEEGIAPAGAEPTSLVELARRLSGEGSSPVELLIVVDADPLHALPAGWGLREALGRIPKTVALSSFRDDTALHADLLLPLLGELERFDAVVPAVSTGVPVVSVCEPVVEPLGDGRHPGDIVLALAAALGGEVAAEFPWPRYRALVESRFERSLENLPGGADGDLRSLIRAAVGRGGIYAEGPPTEVPPGPRGVTAAESETALSSTALVTSASQPEEGASAGRRPARSEYPLSLLPFVSIKAADKGANRPWLQELPDPLSTVMWDSWLEISPRDADELGIHEGDHLRVTSIAGSVEIQATIDPAVRPGVVCMPMGMGHEDYGRYAQGRGVNAMELVDRTVVADSGAPAWAATRVRVERIGPGRLARFGRALADRGEGENIPVGWAPMSAAREKLG